MTAVLSIEATHRARYAQAREALWGKPRVVNVHVDELKAIEAFRKAERERWEQQQKQQRPELSKKSTKPTPSLFERVLKKGTSGRFRIVNTVSYWCFDAREPSGVQAIRSMTEIAVRVMMDYPDVSLEQVKGPERRAAYVVARKAVAQAIRSQRPDLSTIQIGKFLNREHTTVLNLLGRVKQRS